MIKNIKYIPIELDSPYDTLVWTFDFEYDFDILSEIDTNYTGISPGGILPIPGRQIYDYTKSEKLSDCVQEWKNNIVKNLENIFYEKETFELFKKRWPIRQENFANLVRPHTEIFQDLPGFSMGRHLDNQSVIANVIVNLKDNNDGTIFHNYKSSHEVLFQASGKKNTGIIFLNTPSSLHSVQNDVDQTRYILYTSLILKGNWH
jgi:hypothetical protein